MKIKYSPRVLMQEVDRLPSPWRTLIYEYGYQIVMAARNQGLNLVEARKELAVWREHKQQETLSTDHFLMAPRRRPSRKRRYY